MPNMEVDYIFCVRALDADGEGLAGMEGEGHETAGCGGRVPAQ